MTVEKPTGASWHGAGTVLGVSEEQPTGIIVGYVPGVNVAKWRTTWAERFRRTPLDIIEVSADQAEHHVNTGLVDLCFARLPLNTDGWHCIQLWDEVQAAWVSKDHPISLFESVTLADLADETVFTEIDADALSQVTVGEAVLQVPQAVARSYSRRDLAHRPITDAELTRIVLVWRKDNDNSLIDEFIGIVRGRSAQSSRTQQEREQRRSAVRDDTQQRATRTSASRSPRHPHSTKRVLGRGRGRRR